MLGQLSRRRSGLTQPEYHHNFNGSGWWGDCFCTCVGGPNFVPMWSYKQSTTISQNNKISKFLAGAILSRRRLLLAFYVWRMLGVVGLEVHLHLQKVQTPKVVIREKGKAKLRGMATRLKQFQRRRLPNRRRLRWFDCKFTCMIWFWVDVWCFYFWFYHDPN